MGSVNTARRNVILAMVIYGTIGLFVRDIPLPSAAVSMLRGLIGAPFLLLVLLAKGSRLSWGAIRGNLGLLCLLGTALGVNWILLFEAYRYTTVATATLCYYLAPIFIVAASPFVFRERMTAKKACCIAAALVGMVLVSGVAEKGLPSPAEFRGVALGIGAAALYAACVLLNKRLRGISAYDRTFAQLAIAALVLLPYNLASGNLQGLSLTPRTLVLLAIVGTIHTGLSYCLYFGAMEKLDAQALAILSYIDPAVAILLSALVLREPMSAGGALGAVLILGAAAVSEYAPRAQRRA